MGLTKINGTVGSIVLPSINKSYVLPETNSPPPEKMPHQEETIVFQPSTFRREMLVSGRYIVHLDFSASILHPNLW